MPPREDRLTALVAAVLGKAISAAGAAARRRLTTDDGGDPDDVMGPGERKEIRVRVGGQVRRVGWVRVDKGRTKATVTDEAAFTAWVRETAPGEIVPAVRPSYREAVLSQLRREGAAVVPGTGELVEEVPGVEVSEGEPTVYVNAEEDAAEVLGEAYREGGLPALERVVREISGG